MSSQSILYKNNSNILVIIVNKIIVNKNLMTVYKLFLKENILFYDFIICLIKKCKERC